MPRYAKANVTIEDLKNKIESYGEVYEILDEDVAPKVVKDLLKIDVDFENAGLIEDLNEKSLKSYEMIGDYPVAWCYCGGDWQFPLIFVLYIGDDNKLRAYIPSKGNVYDHKNKCAYTGNTNKTIDANQLREDVKNRIEIKIESLNSLYDKNTLKSLKGYIFDGEDYDDETADISNSIVITFLNYICENFKLKHDIEETESTEDYETCWTFENTDDEAYLVFCIGDKNEGNNGLLPCIRIYGKNDQVIIDEEFKDMKEFAEYLDKNKDKLGQIIKDVSETF